MSKCSNPACINGFVPGVFGLYTWACEVCSVKAENLQKEEVQEIEKLSHDNCQGQGLWGKAKVQEYASDNFIEFFIPLQLSDNFLHSADNAYLLLKDIDVPWYNPVIHTGIYLNGEALWVGEFVDCPFEDLLALSSQAPNNYWGFNTGLSCPEEEVLFEKIRNP